MYQDTAISQRRHNLIMMTKGNPAERSGRVEHFGLKNIFPPSRSSPTRSKNTWHSAIASTHCLPTSRQSSTMARSRTSTRRWSRYRPVPWYPHDPCVLEHEIIKAAPPSQQLLVLDRLGDLKTFLTDMETYRTQNKCPCIPDGRSLRAVTVGLEVILVTAR